MKNIQNFEAYEKGYNINFCSQTPPPHKLCLAMFPKNIAFFEILV